MRNLRLALSLISLNSLHEVFLLEDAFLSFILEVVQIFCCLHLFLTNKNTFFLQGGYFI